MKAGRLEFHIQNSPQNMCAPIFSSSNNTKGLYGGYNIMSNSKEWRYRLFMSSFAVKGTRCAAQKISNLPASILRMIR
jgi:hypothetical protein